MQYTDTSTSAGIIEDSHLRVYTAYPLTRGQRRVGPTENILLFSILFCVIALPALGELKVEDLNEIRLIVKGKMES